MSNRDLRLVLQHPSLSSPNGPAFNLFVSGIPHALDPCRQFTTPVYAVSNRSNRQLPIPPGNVDEIIAFILFQNGTIQGDLRDRFESIREIATVSMNERDEGINMAIFNAKGILLNNHQMELLRNSDQPQRLCQAHMLDNQLLYGRMFWCGSGGCPILESDKRQSEARLIPKVLISFIFQPCDHWIHQLTTLREEFIYVISGRLINTAIKLSHKDKGNASQGKVRFVARIQNAFQ
jgi:hypothetical protein